MHEETDDQEFNLFRDDPIQQRLLEVDDEIFMKETQNSFSRTTQREKNVTLVSSSNTAISGETNTCGNKISSAVLQKLAKDIQTAPVCGWYVDPNVVYRKTDRPSKAKKNIANNNKEYGLSRDTKNKPQYVFRHYTDVRHYIEQYRLEHVCSNSAKSPVFRNDDSRRTYPYHQYSPLAAYSQIHGYQQKAAFPLSQHDGTFMENSDKQCRTNHKQQQANAVQDIARNEQQKQTASAKVRGFKKSFSPSNISEMNKDFNMLELPCVRNCSEKLASGMDSSPSSMVVDIHVQKLATAGGKLHGLSTNATTTFPKTGSALELSSGNQFMGQKLGYGTVKQPRVLEALTNFAGGGSEKQSSGVQTTIASSGVQLEPPYLVSKQNPGPKPCLTSILKRGDWPKTTCEDLQVLQRVRSSGQSNASNNRIDATSDATKYVQQKMQEKSFHKQGKVSSQQKLTWTDSSLEAATELGSCRMQTDHWAIIKEEEERSLLSHNRRIKHLIEQSKLKCKFNQILGVNKTTLSKSLLEMASVQITNPFVTAAPDRTRNGNSSKCGRSELNSCFSNSKITKHIYRNGTERAKPGVNTNQNEISCDSEIPENSLVDKMEDMNCFTHSCRFFRTVCGEVQCQEDSGQNVVSSSEPVNAQLLECSHRNSDDIKTSASNNLHKNVMKNEVSWGNVLESSLSEEGNHLPSSINKYYIRKLAEEVAEIVKLTVPKFKYSKLPLAYRSQSMDL